MLSAPLLCAQGLQVGRVRFVHLVREHETQAIARNVRDAEDRHLQPVTGDMAAGVVHQVVEDAVDGCGFQAALRQGSLVAAIHDQAQRSFAPRWSNDRLVPFLQREFDAMALWAGGRLPGAIRPNLPARCA